MRVMGCDPGCYGAISVLNNGVVEEVVSMPFLLVLRGKTKKAQIDLPALAQIFDDWKGQIGHFFIEQVGGIQGQSASAAFNFGRAAGAPEAMAAMAGIPMTLIVPGVWKRRMNCLHEKNQALARANQLFPSAAASWAPKSGGNWDQRVGRAEASLIGLFGWQQLVGAKQEEKTDGLFD